MVTDGKPERYLDLVHKALSKDSDITERNKSILKDLLEGLCKEMTNDRLFALIFNRLYYTGSSYEGLRIRQADEFDINLVMKLPVQEDDFKDQDREKGPQQSKKVKTSLLSTQSQGFALTTKVPHTGRTPCQVEESAAQEGRGRAAPWFSQQHWRSAGLEQPGTREA
ncbi:hypothetical protein HPB49_005311 [Dermacentor silvarum]|uniref:Uncharacterized protein n=1 Tax=Dermacentor silvarum TaxID=543639 RepID=A0ACB8DN81_DERSI|nr:hypothetical protein HPB49_005311 [Dermacentor silvarum]